MLATNNLKACDHNSDCKLVFTQVIVSSDLIESFLKYFEFLFQWNLGVIIVKKEAAYVSELYNIDFLFDALSHDFFKNQVEEFVIFSEVYRKEDI